MAVKNIEEIEKKIAKIVAKQLRINEAEIKNDSSVMEDIGADSLDLVEILMSIEEAFGVNIPDGDVADLKTIADFAKYIADRS